MSSRDPRSIHSEAPILAAYKLRHGLLTPEARRATGGRASLLARLAEGQHVERVHEASRRLDIAVQHAERVAVDVGCQRE